MGRVQGSQETGDRRTKGDTSKQISDDFIMDTNNSSIVSKRSVEKLYYAGEPEYFRHFVSKIKRRSPLINRGYWLRMRAIDSTVENFLRETSPEKKHRIVVNLGCGYDPLPWLFLGKRSNMCDKATFIDVDYPQLMRHKAEVIQKTEQLHSLLPHYAVTGQSEGVLATSDAYLGVGCDLRNLDLLSLIMRERLGAGTDEGNIAILFVAEVSIAYMELSASQAVLDWASQYSDVRFCLLEQHLPAGADHPFAQTMLKHFEKLKTPLKAIGTMSDMHGRFVAAGWPKDGIRIRSLWDLWADDDFLSPVERSGLDKVEPFDEWEEFAMFSGHYFLLVATKVPEAGVEPIESEASLQNSTASAPSPSRTEVSLVARALPGLHSHRRFGAVLLPGDSAHPDRVALHGGLGTRERQNDSVTFSTTDDADHLIGPPLNSGLMCHSITSLFDPSEALLVGGRTSPDRASADCWLRSGGEWRRAQNMPEGRYRHCAVLVTTKHGSAGVLVFGGKTSDGQALDSWLLWSREDGWKRLDSRIPMATPDPSRCQTVVARFGAAMVRSWENPHHEPCGLLMGGMTTDGTVIDDCWSWSLEAATMSLVMCDKTSEVRARLGALADSLSRFGAQLVPSQHGILLIGGVSSKGVLKQESEVISLTHRVPVTMHGHRPFLVGHSIVGLSDGLLVLGGGATCFSFGSYWNPDATFQTVQKDCCEVGQEENAKWHLLPGIAANPRAAGLLLTLPVKGSDSVRGRGDVEQIDRVTLSGHEDFERILRNARPVIITDLNIGACTRSWSLEYLKEAIGVERRVVVHEARTSKMDFQRKNFKYVTQEFGAFADAIGRGERMYLRALSKHAPDEMPTTLEEAFPEIAGDFHLPSEVRSVVAQRFHSSVLRMSGPVQMWLHFDVMANVLCQVKGSKRVRLFEPGDAVQLGIEPGASSSSTDAFGHDLGRHVTPHECVLAPGEVLFIPAFWPHSAAPDEGLSVAVNVFFRSLAQGYAAGRDVYGNRDLAGYVRGRADLAKIVQRFNDVPDDVRRFYIRRLAAELLASGD